MKSHPHLISIALCLAMLPLAASALTPPPPVPWFDEEIVIDPDSLPEDVEVVPGPYSLSSLVNQSDERFYLILAVSEADSLPSYRTAWRPEGLPSEYVVEDLLVSGRRYRRFTNTSISDPGGLGAGSPWYKHPENALPLRDLNVALEGPSRQIYDGDVEGDRPEGVAVPAPQSFTVEAFYRGQMWKIRGAITYSLNESYVPRSERRPVKEEFFEHPGSIGGNPFGISRSGQELLLLMAIGLPTVGLIGWLTAKQIRKKRTKTTAPPTPP